MPDRWFAKEWRLARGMSQSDVAERMGVLKDQVSRWERRERTPDLNVILGLADAIGFEPWQLLTDPNDRLIMVRGDEAIDVARLRSLPPDALAVMRMNLELLFRSSADRPAETPHGPPAREGATLARLPSNRAPR